MLRTASWPPWDPSGFDGRSMWEVARERLRECGLIDRVEIAAGDFYVDPLPGGHDLVLLSAIIHQNGSGRNRALYESCFGALEPGGNLVIREILMDESHTQPPGGALFAINMLLATQDGGTFSFEEIRSDLEAAGFVEVELIQRGVWMDGLPQAGFPEPMVCEWSLRPTRLPGGTQISPGTRTGSLGM